MNDSKPINAPQWYTTKEVAKMLRVSERTVFEMLQSQQLRSVKVRGCRRIPESCLLEMEQRKLGESA